MAIYSLNNINEEVEERNPIDDLREAAITVLEYCEYLEEKTRLDKEIDKELDQEQARKENEYQKADRYAYRSVAAGQIKTKEGKDKADYYARKSREAWNNAERDDRSNAAKFRANQNNKENDIRQHKYILDDDVAKRVDDERTIAKGYKTSAGRDYIERHRNPENASNRKPSDVDNKINSRNKSVKESLELIYDFLDSIDD